MTDNNKEKFLGLNPTWLTIAILISLYALICFFSYNKCSGFIYDTFKEALIPEQILKGKVLYKDIYCLYPPAAFYLNAVIFKCFGNNLNILFYISFVNTIIILCCLYKCIQEVSQNKILTPFITVLTVMLIFVSRIKEPDSASWFYPYSYSFTYAFTFCFLFLTFLILCIKRGAVDDNKHSNLYLYFASLFLGLSVAFKLDFILCFLILVFFIFKTKSPKIIFKSLLIFFLPIILEFLLFLVNIKFDLFILEKQINVLYNFANNPSVKNFNHYCLPQSLNLQLLHQIKNSFVHFNKYFLISICVSSALYLLYNFIIRKKYILSIIFIFTIFLGISNIKYNNLFNYLFYTSNMYLHFNLTFLNYLVLLLTICIIVYKKIKKIKFKYDEKIFYVLIIIAYAITFRNYAGIYISYIGNFTLIIFWGLFIILLLDIIPYNFKLCANKKYKIIICTALIIYSLTYTYQYAYNLIHLNNKISSPKATFYVSDCYYTFLNKAITHAQENIVRKNKSLLYIEEGLYLHYLLDIPVINFQIYSIESYSIPALGDDYIKYILQEQKPDYIYIFLTPISLNSSHGRFGVDYGKEINEFILDNYIKESTTINNLYIYDKGALEIYRKKNN